MRGSAAHAQAYKAGCVAAVREYFASGQAEEVRAALQELGHPAHRHVLVKHVRSQALRPLRAVLPHFPAFNPAGASPDITGGVKMRGAAQSRLRETQATLCTPQEHSLQVHPHRDGLAQAITICVQVVTVHENPLMLLCARPCTVCLA